MGGLRGSRNCGRLEIRHANANLDEIDLEDEEGDEGENEVGAAVRLPEASPEREFQEDDDEPGPVYIDTSLPPPNRKSRAAQVMIDAILAKNEGAGPAPPKKQAKKAAAPQGLGQFLSALQGPPPMPPPTIQQLHQVQQVQQVHPWPLPPRGNGQRNALWYVDYYDQSFNENPWLVLEMSKGLQPLGSWIERAERKP